MKNPTTRLMIEKLSVLAALGTTYDNAAKEIDASYHYVVSFALRHGISFTLRQRGRPASGPDNRSEIMRDRYIAGETLEQIGKDFKITRERVRQVITKFYNIRGDAGGKSEQVRKARTAFMRKRDLRSLRLWGCKYKEYRQLLDREDKPTYAYWSQRKNAITRGIGWELSLWQWWKIWDQSGFWVDRGRGRGYGMCRLNDVGPYSPDNVYIATGIENMQDYWVNRRAADAQVAA